MFPSQRKTTSPIAFVTDRFLERHLVHSKHTNLDLGHIDSIKGKISLARFLHLQGSYEILVKN